MPIPHQEMRRIIKRRIHGTEGTERIKILRALLEELPGYRSGPYGDLRKWVHQLIEEATVRRSVKHKDEFQIPKDSSAEAQVVLVGPPNAGKSTLLRALTGRPVAVGNYRFTTLRPAAGILNHGGARIQLVDLPGLVEGAREGAGGGKILLGCIRAADALIYCFPAEVTGFSEGLLVAKEIAGSGIHLPSATLLTKSDLPDWEWLASEAKEAFPELPLTVINQGGDMDPVGKMIWDLLDMIRVWPCPKGQRAPDPVVLPVGSTIEDFMNKLDRRWVERFRLARVTGDSTRFSEQPVGLGHQLTDGDQVTLQLSR